MQKSHDNFRDITMALHFNTTNDKTQLTITSCNYVRERTAYVLHIFFEAHTTLVHLAFDQM